MTSKKSHDARPVVQIQLGAQKDEEQAVVQELLADPEQAELRRCGSLHRSPHQTVAPTGHRVCATVAFYQNSFWISMFGQPGGFPTRLHGETFPVADWARTCAGVAKHLHPSKATPTRFGRTRSQCALSQSGRSRRVDGENQCISAECTRSQKWSSVTVALQSSKVTLSSFSQPADVDLQTVSAPAQVGTWTWLRSQQMSSISPNKIIKALAWIYWSCSKTQTDSLKGKRTPD